MSHTPFQPLQQLSKHKRSLWKAAAMGLLIASLPLQTHAHKEHSFKKGKLIATLKGDLIHQRSKKIMGHTLTKVFHSKKMFKFVHLLQLNARGTSYHLHSTIVTNNAFPFHPYHATTKTLVNGKQVMNARVKLLSRGMHIKAHLARDKRGKKLKKPRKLKRFFPYGKPVSGPFVYNQTLCFLAPQLLQKKARLKAIFLEFPDDITNPINHKPGALIKKKQTKGFTVIGGLPHRPNYLKLTFSQSGPCTTYTIGNKFIVRFK